MKGKHLHFAAGLLVGAALFGGGTALAAGILAEPSSQTFYVDGQQIQMEAYAISGNNYVKLRDVGRAVDFGVTYDGATNSVRMDSTAPYTEEVKTTPAPADGIIVVPQSDAPFRPLAGDVVRIDESRTFTVTEAKPEEPALPTATCDWSQFPEIALPNVRITTSDRGHVNILNLYETRRMEYTLYNSIGTCDEVWADGTLRLSSKGNPLVSVRLDFEKLTSIQHFWPWRDNQLTQVFLSRPKSRLAVQAWDVYLNGKYIYTDYMIQSL